MYLKVGLNFIPQYTHVTLNTAKYNGAHRLKGCKYGLTNFSQLFFYMCNEESAVQCTLPVDIHNQF